MHMFAQAEPVHEIILALKADSKAIVIKDVVKPHQHACNYFVPAMHVAEHRHMDIVAFDTYPVLLR